MSDVERLLREFIAGHSAGESPDPRDFVEQTQGAARRELTALIDAYLVRAPRRRWDPAAFRQSGAAAVAEGLGRSLAGAAGTWPALLPRLRARARLRRSELVERLAAALGADDRREKVGAYYHEMEQGLLPAAGVSARVLDALAGILGESADSLRAAGAALRQGPGRAGDAPAFARTVAAEPMSGPGAAEADAGAPPELPRSPAKAVPPAGEWDEVDRLFRGGG